MKNRSVTDFKLCYFENNPVPSINIIDIENLVKDKLPLITLDSDSLDNNKVVIGEGYLFTEEKYNLAIVIPCLIISLIILNKRNTTAILTKIIQIKTLMKKNQQHSLNLLYPLFLLMNALTT